MYKLSEVWQFTKIKLTDYSNGEKKVKIQIAVISGNERKTTSCFTLKCLKGKTLPDNRVKQTYETVTLSPPQLFGNETFSDIINGIDNLHVFERELLNHT